jgi:hypothetical protein
LNNDVHYQSVNLDFTIKTYKILISALIDQGFSFFTFSDYISGHNHDTKSIILRHDVDKLPLNSLRFAQIQKEFGLKCTYYFRMVPGSWNENVISQIASMGHEVGYHYEDLSLVWKRLPTLLKLKVRNYLDFESSREAIASFEENLMKLRSVAPVLTICMHGSPLSQWDSRMLWKYYDFRDYGIIGPVPKSTSLPASRNQWSASTQVLMPPSRL